MVNVKLFSGTKLSVLSVLSFLPEEIVAWRITGKTGNNSVWFHFVCFFFFFFFLGGWGGGVVVVFFFYADVFHKCSFIAYFQLVTIMFPLSPKRFKVGPELKV